MAAFPPRGCIAKSRRWSHTCCAPTRFRRHRFCSPAPASSSPRKPRLPPAIPCPSASRKSASCLTAPPWSASAGPAFLFNLSRGGAKPRIVSADALHFALRTFGPSTLHAALQCLPHFDRQGAQRERLLQERDRWVERPLLGDGLARVTGAHQKLDPGALAAHFGGKVVPAQLGHDHISE